MRGGARAQDSHEDPTDHTTEAETRAMFMYARKVFTLEHRGASGDLRAGRPTEVPAMCFPPTTPFQREVGAIWATSVKRK